MLSVFGFVQLLGALIAVEAHDAKCPSASQVRAALEARIPAEAAEASAAGRSRGYRLRITDAQGVSVLQLFDDQNHLELQRALAAGAESNCAALAETVAIIVERYLAELNIVPLAPPPLARTASMSEPPRVPPTWQVLLQTRWKSGRPGAGAWGAEMAAGRDLGQARRWNIELALGGALPGRLAWTDAQQAEVGRGRRLHLWSLLSAGPQWLSGHHRWMLRGSGGVGAVRASRTAPGEVRAKWGVEPWLGAGGLYRWVVAPKGTTFTGAGIFVQLAAAARVALIRHQFVLTGTDDAGLQVVNDTPRIFADIGIGAGLEF